MIVHASAKSEVRRAKHTFHAESAAEGGTWAELRTPPLGCSSSSSEDAEAGSRAGSVQQR